MAKKGIALKGMDKLKLYFYMIALVIVVFVLLGIMNEVEGSTSLNLSFSNAISLQFN